MHQPIRPADVDEGAKVGQADHVALADIAWFQLADQLLLEQLARLLGGGPLREDQAVAAPIDLDHLGHHRLADHLAPALIRGLPLRPAPPGQTDLGGGDEPTQVAEFDDQTALVVAADVGVQRLLGSQQTLSLAPIVLLIGTRQRQQHLAVVSAGAHDVHADLLADDQLGSPLLGQLLELAGLNQPFGLGADVDQDVPPRHAGDRADSNLAPARRLEVIAFASKQRVHGRCLVHRLLALWFSPRLCFYRIAQDGLLHERLEVHYKGEQMP